MTAVVKPNKNCICIDEEEVPSGPSKDSLKPDPEKIQAVQEMTPPPQEPRN